MMAFAQLSGDPTSRTISPMSSWRIDHQPYAASLQLRRRLGTRMGPCPALIGAALAETAHDAQAREAVARYPRSAGPSKDLAQCKTQLSYDNPMFLASASGSSNY